MRIGRCLAGAAALTAVGVLVAPGLASAHTAEANPSCDGLSVTVGLYDPTVVTTITIDGRSTEKHGNGVWDTPWDSSESHSWKVQVTDPVDHQDRTFGPATQEACVTPTTASPTTTTAPPPPTTTQPPATTTTTPDGPTTTAAATSTTQPGATTTTTRSSSGGGSSSSGGSGGSTSGRVSAASGSSALPATGYASGTIAAIAAALLLAGAAMWLVARRRPS